MLWRVKCHTFTTSKRYWVYWERVWTKDEKIRTINQKSLFLDRGSGCVVKIPNDGLGPETSKRESNIDELRLLVFLWLEYFQTFFLRVTKEWAHVLKDRGRVGDQNVALFLTGNLWWIGTQSGNKLVNDVGCLLCVDEV